MSSGVISTLVVLAVGQVSAISLAWIISSMFGGLNALIELMGLSGV